MHSSRMCIACCNCRFSYHACPPAMHAPCHAHPPPHIPVHYIRMCIARCNCRFSCHACPPCHAHPHHACPLPCTPPPHVLPAMHAPHYACPPTKHAPLPCTPPVDRILDIRLWKYCLAATSLRAVKTKTFQYRNATLDIQRAHLWWYPFRNCDR